jgi:hypothetical protein
MLEQYSKDKMRSEISDSKPPPSPVDDELVEAFVALEIQACSRSNPHTNRNHQGKLEYYENKIRNIPQEFATLKEAQAMMEVVMLRAIHLRFIVAQAVDSLTAEHPVPPLVGLEVNLSPEVQLQLMNALSDFTSCWSAVEPLYKKSRLPEGLPMLYRASVLRCQYLVSYLWTASGLPVNMWYRAYGKEMREIVDLIKLVVIPVGASTSFTLDYLLILPLMVVAWNYRHIQLRREIIEIFSNMKRFVLLLKSYTLKITQRWLFTLFLFKKSKAEKC